jgi:hypothetical protein
MIPRLLTAALAMTVLVAGSLPCGFGPGRIVESGVASPDSAAHAHGSDGDVARVADSEPAGMPCHGAASELPPPFELTLPCTCGCDQRAAGGGAGLTRLPVAVLLPELEATPASRAPVPPLPVFEVAPGFPSTPDVVPWA